MFLNQSFKTSWTMSLNCAELLSPDECLLIARRTLGLAEDDKIVVLGSQLKPGSSELVGYNGEYYKLCLTIHHKSRQDFKYFIKSLPRNNSAYREACERMGFFSREAKFYTQILPKIQKYASKRFCARCFYTRKDLIVLEDLTQEHRHVKPTENYTLEHFKLVLSQAAELHAAGIAWEQAEQFNIGERFRDELFEIHMTTNNEWFRAGIKCIVFLASRHPNYQTPSAQKFISENLFNILAESSKISEISRTQRNVFCHRDSWNLNIFYKFEHNATVPSSCCFVDFQLITYGPPILEVLLILFLIAPPGLRKAITAECLDYYIDRLHSRFSRLNISPNVLTKENFLRNYKRAHLAALTMWAICEPLIKLPKGVANKLRLEEPEKFDYYLNEERHELYLRVMEVFSDYEQTIMEPIGELMDYVLDNKEEFIRVN